MIDSVFDYDISTVYIWDLKDVIDHYCERQYRIVRVWDDMVVVSCKTFHLLEALNIQHYELQYYDEDEEEWFSLSEEQLLLELIEDFELLYDFFLDSDDFPFMWSNEDEV